MDSDSDSVWSHHSNYFNLRRMFRRGLSYSKKKKQAPAKVVLPACQLSMCVDSGVLKCNHCERAYVIMLAFLNGICFFLTMSSFGWFWGPHDAKLPEFVICATRGCQSLQDVDAGVHSLQYFEDVWRCIACSIFLLRTHLVARKRTRWRSHVDRFLSIFGVQECPGNVGIAARFPFNREHYDKPWPKIDDFLQDFDCPCGQVPICQWLKSPS